MRQSARYFFLLVIAAEVAAAQTASLSLSSAADTAATPSVLTLSLGGSAGPASLEWSVSYPTASVAALSVTAGSALTAAGKSLTCSATAGSYECVASGLNTTAIQNGPVASVSITPALSSGVISLSLVNTSAVSAAGASIATATTGGALTVGSSAAVQSVACSPSSITTPGTSSCTVTLNAAAPTGGATVALSSTNGNLSVPASLSIPAGAASAAFTASGTSVNVAENVTLTASFNASSASAAISLLPPVQAGPSLLPNSLGCIPASLPAAGSATCTLILTGLAPAGGAPVALSSSNSALSVPASVTVPAGSSSITFTATAAAVGAAQPAVITASANGGSQIDSLTLNSSSGPQVLNVGPGQTYTAPCAALTTAPDGATIRIDASGTYSADVCAVTANNLTVKGINGRPVINAAGLTSGGKGAWVFQGNNITLDTVELTGAVSATNNGAGLLMTGKNLSVLNSYIHDNQEGLVTAASPFSQVLIEATEFNHNGFGDGVTHNIDVNSAARLTLQYSYSHTANAGDLVKSLASENYILYNRLTSEQGTTNSEVDLTNGGRSFLIGNLIEKGPSDLGNNLVGYLLGGTSAANPSTELYVVNNTLVSDKSTGVTFLDIASGDTTPAIATNNIVYGAGTFSTQSTAVLTANLTSNPNFVNQAGYDYHLTSGSAAINAGTASGPADGVSLVPGYQYLHPSCGQVRALSGAIDIGAFEYGGAGAPLYCALAVSGLTINPASVIGGAAATGSVTLSVPAPSAGTVVTLSSSSAAATVPASITIPSGELSGSFNIVTSAVAAATSATLSASNSGSTQTALLTIGAPAAAATVNLSSLACSPTSLHSGGISTCTVSLTAVAPAGGSTIALSSTTSLLNVPKSVVVPAGAVSATFSAKAGWIRYSRKVTVTAKLGTTSRSVTFQLAH